MDSVPANKGLNSLVVEDNHFGPSQISQGSDVSYSSAMRDQFLDENEPEFSEFIE